MKKVALLLKGKPNKGEDRSKFYRNVDRDVEIMESLVQGEGYSVQFVEEDNLKEVLKNNYGVNETMIYYTGHGGENSFWEADMSSFLKNLSSIPGKKVIILDACSGENLEDVVLPKSSKLIGAKQLSMRGSIAMMLWDYVVVGGNKLGDITKASFDDMKHQNVYCFLN